MTAAGEPDGDGAADELAAAVRDAAYVVVGFGVLGFQRAQVRRRELQRWAKDVEQRVDPLLDDLEERVDPLLDDLESRLPDKASDVVRQLRQTARDARDHLRGPAAGA